jgi:hypothetical protein
MNKMKECDSSFFFYSLTCKPVHMTCKIFAREFKIPECKRQGILRDVCLRDFSARVLKMKDNGFSVAGLVKAIALIAFQ